MAKQPSDELDPFDDPFDSEIDDADIDSLRITNTDDDDDPFDNEVDESDLDVDGDKARRAKQATGARPRPTIGQIIIGVLQVIVIGVIALAIFLGVSFGAVFGGQRLGLVPTRAPGGSGPLIALIPTIAPTQSETEIQQVAAATQNAPTLTPIPPTATPDPTCSTANDWWNSQQVQSNYQYFTAQALNDVRAGAQPNSALLEQMRIHRNFVANFPVDPCLNDAQAALLRAFDATIEAGRAYGAKDAEGFATQQDNATKAYDDMAADLRKFGVTVTLSAPPTPAS